MSHCYVGNLVYFVFSVRYIIYIYRSVKEWRKNPKWSLSCCLALLLPLNELQGEIRGLAATNVLKQQLQTGRIDMPSMTTTIKDSGMVNFTLEEEEESTDNPSRIEDGERPSNFSSENNTDVTVVTIHTAKPAKSYERAV